MRVFGVTADTLFPLATMAGFGMVGERLTFLNGFLSTSRFSSVTRRSATAWTSGKSAEPTRAKSQAILLATQVVGKP
jgi:hypothetical protein